MLYAKKIKDLENRISKLEDEQRVFMDCATRILQSVQTNDKKRYMYELQVEDVELIEDGKKIRKIRKYLNNGVEIK